MHPEDSRNSVCNFHVQKLSFFSRQADTDTQQREQGENHHFSESCLGGREGGE